MKSLIILLHICVCVFSTYGSVIELTSSATTIKPLLTSDMTMRCSLKDSSPSSQVIGKRSVDGLGDIDDLLLSTAPDTNTEDSTYENGKQQMKRSVTQTDSNMKFAVSMVISRDGVDLATVSEHFAATAAPGLTGFDVTGQVNSGGNTCELGYLQIHWKHPSLTETGTYTCEISALSQTGHSIMFARSQEVTAGDVTIADLVNYVHASTVEREKMAETFAQDKNDLNRTIASLTQELASLKAVARTEPDIFFTAGLSRSKTFPIGDTVVYDKVITNQGSAYNNATGTFTAPLAGYYKFNVYMSADSRYGQLRIRVNGADMMDMACWLSDNVNNSANGLIVKLAKGDKVNVYSYFRTSYLYSHNNYVPLNSFSGQLLSTA